MEVGKVWRLGKGEELPDSQALRLLNTQPLSSCCALQTCRPEPRTLKKRRPVRIERTAPSRFKLFLLLVLELVELVIKPAPGQQLAVRAALAELPFV